jgi:phosphoribosylglycinamide formyltransferase-1
MPRLKMKNIVLFASGNGTNAQSIMDYFEQHKGIQVSLVLSNKSDAQVLERASKKMVPAMYFNKFAFAKANSIQSLLQSINPDLIVLAGFLWKFPDYLVEAFPNKIINIHPALLPSYGGKGMYGMHVHEAVVANNEVESGITIHYVNEHYDEGAIIAQHRCPIAVNDTAKEVASKIHALEQAHFAREIEKLLA